MQRRKTLMFLSLSLTLLIVSCSSSVEGGGADSEFKPTQILSSEIKKVDNDTYEFGYFAQTKVDKSELSFSSKTASNGWYIGSDGNYYGKAGDDYYKVEPIVWKVFSKKFNHEDNCSDGTDVILIPQNVLISGIPYSEFTENRTISGNTVYPNNYEYSNLRAFLNGYDLISDGGTTSKKYKVENFLNMAFTREAQAKILTTLVKNDGLSSNDYNNTGWSRIDGTKGNDDDGNPLSTSTGQLNYTSSNVNDKVFALSIWDYSNSVYGISKYSVENGTNASIKRTATEYCKDIGINEEISGYSPYFGRTPYYKDASKVRIVNQNGLFYDNNIVNNIKVGIVPAIAVAATVLN